MGSTSDRHRPPHPHYLRRYFDAAFLRFMVVGVSNFLVSLAVFRGMLVLLSGSSLKGTLSQLASYAAGTIWSFVWNRRYTFRSSSRIGPQAIRFLLLQALLAVSSSILVGAGVDVLGLSPLPTWVVVMAAITIANYLGCRSWVFRQEPNDRPA